MNTIKAITQIPGWMEMMEQADKLTTEASAYSFVPLIYRAVRLRADAIASVPGTVETDGGDEAAWPYKNDLSTLLWNTEASMLLSGAAYWLKLPWGPVWLNPYSVTVEFDAAKGRNIFTQDTGLGYNGPWTSPDEIVYFREWDPTQDTAPGISPAKVTLTNAQLQHYVTQFAYYFFESGAMPVTVLGMTNVSQSEVERTEGVFRKMMTTVKNAFRIIGVRADAIDIKTITPPLGDLALTEIWEQSKKNIASAFGIPITMLEEPAANRATAETHRLSFWSETIRPRGRIYENTINNQLLQPLGLKLKFNFDEMDVFQEDERERAASLQALVASGLPLDISLRTLGFELSDEDWETLDQEAKDKAARRDAMLQNFTQGGSSSQDEDQDEDEQPAPEEKRMRELRRWRRKAKKALARKNELAGKQDLSRSEKNWLSSYSTFTAWKSTVIPASITDRIHGMIQVSETQEDIDEIFDRFDDLTGGSYDELVDTLREAITTISETRDADN